MLTGQCAALAKTSSYLTFSRARRKLATLLAHPTNKLGIVTNGFTIHITSTVGPVLDPDDNGPSLLQAVYASVVATTARQRSFQPCRRTDMRTMTASPRHSCRALTASALLDQPCHRRADCNVTGRNSAAGSTRIKPLELTDAVVPYPSVHTWINWHFEQ